MWRGLRRLGSGLRPALAALWRLLGRMGLALRNLLTWIIWRPFHFLALPWYLLGRRIFYPRLVALVKRAAGGITFALRWLAARLGIWWRFLRTRWQASRAGRLRLMRGARSRWLLYRARLRLVLLRPQPPPGATVIPAVPRPREAPVRRRATRLATTVVAAVLVAVASLITAR
ncbi:MAG: hypothetical protein R3272_04160, partial [Candidatus Promineifilaceae bacterium]|nr:hypothetical protein [Candidatus Promineifilaceae bacterium]